MKIISIILFLSIILASCGGNPSSPTIPIPTQTTSPSPILPNVFMIPLAKYIQVLGCDYNNTPCASGKDGKVPGYHTGRDYWSNPPGNNEPVYASGPGKVVMIQKDGENDHGMGNAVILEHRTSKIAPPIYTLYAHLQKIDANVVNNYHKCINQHSPIGLMGSSGKGEEKHWGNTPHLHFEFKILPVLSNPIPKPDTYWGYIPETEPDHNPTNWGYRDPGDYIDKVSVLACNAWPYEPTDTPTVTSTPLGALLTPTQMPHFPTTTPTNTPTFTPTPPSQEFGKQLAYIGEDGNIWLIDTESQNKKRLTDIGAIASSPPYWSSSGDEIAFIKYTGDNQGTYGIYITNTDGSNLVKLTTFSPGMLDAFSDISWSPDGQLIAYGTKVSNRYDIYTVKYPEGSLMNLTNNPGYGYYTVPSWSPDGERIAFLSNSPERSVDLYLYAMSLADRIPINLSQKQVWAITNYRWSPNGSYIAFIGHPEGSPICGEGSDPCREITNLFVATTNGSSVKNLTNHSSSDSYPDWSPDGKTITFSSSSENGRGEIYLVNADGSGLRNITNNAADDISPRWSPDGEFIAFSSNRNGNQDIYVMRPDGSDVNNLTNSPGDEKFPVWQPGPPPMRSVLTPTPVANPSQLDLSGPESIVYWLAYDMANGQTGSFRQVITSDSISYGWGISGQFLDTVDSLTFLADLQKRIQNRPTCGGYDISDDRTSITIWTTDWKPLWDFRGKIEYKDITFYFGLQDGQIFTYASLAPAASLALQYVDHKPCPFLEQNKLIATSTPESNKQYARITNQVTEVNLRSTPGYENKDDFTDVIAKIPSGEIVEIIGGPVEEDGLNWWKIIWNGYTGWIADHSSSECEIMDFSP